MTNDAAWLRAMATVLRRIAAARKRNPDLEGELRGLAVLCCAGALMIEEDDEFRSEAPTPTARELTRVGVIHPAKGTP